MKTTDVLIIGGTLIGVLILVEGLTGDGDVIKEAGGFRLGQTSFDTLYRIGDVMHLTWHFGHKGTSQDISLGFAVSNANFWGRASGQPVATLYKNVHVNDDDGWQDYAIDHQGVLIGVSNSLQKLAPVSYIVDSSGRVIVQGGVASGLGIYVV